MTSWVLVGFEVFVFYGVLQFMWSDAVRWSLVAGYSAILVTLLVSAGYSTCCDPIDPLAPLPPATAAEVSRLHCMLLLCDTIRPLLVCFVREFPKAISTHG